jgi:hypothetical protein
MMESHTHKPTITDQKTAPDQTPLPETFQPTTGFDKFDVRQPVTPNNILQLQRTIGNKAVQHLLRVQHKTAPQAIQRDIKVQNVDFEPIEGEYSHGFIDVTRFARDLEDALKNLYGNKPQGKLAQQDAYGEVRHPQRFKAVMEHVAARSSRDDNAPNYQARDIPTLAQVIANDIEAVYKKNDATGGWSSLVRDGIKGVVQDVLLRNLVDDYKMQAGEKHAFKQLIKQAGAAASREKEAPTPLTMAKLGDVAAAVRTVRTAILQAHNAMTRAAFQFEWTNEDILRQHFTMDYYQGNHTNNAGWLPTPPLPVNWLPTLRTAILTNATVIGTGGMVAALGANDAQAQIDANPLWQPVYAAAYNAAAPAASPAYSDNAFRKMAWLAMGSGVSPYIEFAIPGHSDGISRLIYDFVGNNFYVTAHYKWTEGYNPFFHITDLRL